MLQAVSKQAMKGEVTFHVSSRALPPRRCCAQRSARQRAREAARARASPPLQPLRNFGATILSHRSTAAVPTPPAQGPLSFEQMLQDPVRPT